MDNNKKSGLGEIVDKIDLDNGWWFYAKDIGRTLAKTTLNSTYRAIIDCILDMTYGWHDPKGTNELKRKRRKTKEYINFKEFEEYTGIGKTNLSKHITNLIKWNIVKRWKNGKKLQYSLNVNVNEWNRGEAFRVKYQIKVIQVDNHLISKKDSKTSSNNTSDLENNKKVIQVDNHIDDTNDTKVIQVDNHKVIQVDNQRLFRRITKTDLKANENADLPDAKELLQGTIIRNYKKETIRSEESLNKKPISFQLAVYLDGKIRENNKRFKKRTEAQLIKWAEDIEKLIRIDKVPPKEISQVIDWVVEDKFWSPNILSANKLREHYPKLYKKAIDRGRSLKENLENDHRFDDLK